MTIPSPQEINQWKEDAEKYNFLIANDYINVTENALKVLRAENKKYKEDAKAYNDLMNANAQVVKDNINITKEHQIVEQLKKELDGDFDKDFCFEYNCHNLHKEILQKILDVGGWTDKHTKIAKESDERFKLHTEDQEVDI